MEPADLEARSRALQERLSSLNAQPLVAVRLDILKNLIEKLDSNPGLQQLLGNPPSQHLALVWDQANNDVLVADANIGEIDEVSRIRFLKILDEVLSEHS